MRCVQCIVQGPATAKPSPVNWSSSAWGSLHCWIDDLHTPVPASFPCGQVDVLTTVVLTVKAEHFDLLDVPRRIESLNDFSHIVFRVTLDGWFGNKESLPNAFVISDYLLSLLLVESKSIRYQS